MNAKIEKILRIIITIASVLFLVLSILLFIIFLFKKEYFNTSFQLNMDLAEQFGTFFSGLVGTTAAIAGSLLIILVFLYQNKQSRINQLENVFYKMVDYHRENVNNIFFKQKDKAGNIETFSGQGAFVKLKLYLFKCQSLIVEADKYSDQKLSREDILDLSYVVFFYGIDSKWKSFSLEQLKKYDNDLLDFIFNLAQKEFNISTQTTLSCYFRNLYNAIILIDSNEDLSQKEKYNYIKLLRAQLSNNELCLLYFDIMSRYGTKWRQKKLVEKYKFLKNIPPKFCNSFEPREDFNINYEDEEYN